MAAGCTELSKGVSIYYFIILKYISIKGLLLLFSKKGIKSYLPNQFFFLRSMTADSLSAST